MRRRILSIQGGGVNGIFAAKLLALVEEDLERDGLPARSGAYFDLISGTSTGGLIALGLALGIPASEIVKIYDEKSALIFPRWSRNKVWKLRCRVPTIRRPFYSSEPLIRELKAVFGQRRLGDARTRIVIPAYNQSSDRVHLFKTAHHGNFQRDFRLFAWDVAAATAAAPFFFPPHKMQNSVSFLDGGVWANNPILVAIAECIQYCQWDRGEIDILSISGVRDAMGESYWRSLIGLPSALLRSQVKGSVASAKTLIGDVNGASQPRGRVYDVASDVPTGTFEMDDAQSVGELLGKADTLFRSRGKEIRDLFFVKPTEEFQPVHRLEV